MEGKIVKLTGGFYYVYSDGKVYETRARGNFRHKDTKPVVGDIVEFKYEEDKLGYIEKVYPRTNILIRPSVANVDQVLIVIPIKDPKYNLNLVDRMIIAYENKVDIFIVINKYDLDESEAKKLMYLYKNAGFKTFMVSNKDEKSLESLREHVEGKTTALSGVSAAGKSTIASYILGREVLVGGISEKTRRGKHTTRHVELLFGENDTYLFDTPGFSSMDLSIDSDRLQEQFREFKNFRSNCRFNNCNHINEPHCAVKEAVESGEVEETRYKNYVSIFNDLKEKGKY